MFVGQLYKDKSLMLRSCDWIFFTTDLLTTQVFVVMSKNMLLMPYKHLCPDTVNWILPVYQQFTARADLIKMTIVKDRTVVISTEFVIVRGPYVVEVPSIELDNSQIQPLTFMNVKITKDNSDTALTL